MIVGLTGLYHTVSLIRMMVKLHVYTALILMKMAASHVVVSVLIKSSAKTEVRHTVAI